VAEIGTGLNTRFERVDNGDVHWFDLDLPDTIELRRRFFADTGRRQMIAASVLDQEWLETVTQSPRPYFFVAEGVLHYLPEDDATRTLTRIAQRFPGALVALDTYPQRTFDRAKRAKARANMAQWAWACDDPRSLERPDCMSSTPQRSRVRRGRCELDYRPGTGICCRSPILCWAKPPP
jgi:O-methyltransferase involved in polyketide biosynthesis